MKNRSRYKRKRQTEITLISVENLLINYGKTCEALFEIGIRRDYVAHVAVVIGLVCSHVEEACSRKVEQDGLVLSRLLAL